MIKTDYDEIVSMLAQGQLDALETAAVIVDDFPQGKDAFVQRHWITNAIDLGCFAAVEWMIGKGVTLIFRDAEGYTPLHSCIEREKSDRYDMMAVLIKAGADCTAHGINDWTPLHMAAMRDDRPAMKMLIDAGADVSRRTRIDDYATPAEEARALGHHASADFIDKYAAGRYPFND